MTTKLIIDVSAAFPQSCTADGRMSTVPEGMTLRMYTAINLRIPNSGLDWLDDMIRVRLRDEIAQQFLNSALEWASSEYHGNREEIQRVVIESCYKVADVMMQVREK